MIGTRNGSTVSVASLVLVVVGGCVLREEKIKIARDGAVRIDFEITGTEEELKSGAAMPTAVAGWTVTQRTKEEDGTEKLVVASSRHFQPGAVLPRTLAAHDDPDAELYLDYPTEVKVEERSDGIYYTFHRTFTPRRWAFSQYWHDVFIDNDIKRFAETPIEELKREEQREIIKAFASVEALQQLEFAKAALAETAPDFPIESALLARSALLAVYARHGLLTDEDSPKAFGEALLAPVETKSGLDGLTLDAMIDRCEALEGADHDACYDDSATRLFAEAFETYTASLRESGALTGAALRRFEHSYERAKRTQKLTDALGGQHFETTVRMPGTIIAHNANDLKRYDEASEMEATWQFQGTAFRDRTHELWAVSRVTWDEQSRMRIAADDDDR